MAKHSHFLFVETNDSNFGSELEFRHYVELELGRRFAGTVPIVLITIEGGNGALKQNENVILIAVI